MPLRNRVNPWGVIQAVAPHGTWMGNRGVLHDDERSVVRPSNARAWIICQLEFKGRRRELMTPGRYTELFFVDEATALAAGHRPCFECRRDAATEFLLAWQKRGGRGQAAVGDVDRELAEQRRIPRSGLNEGKRAYVAYVSDLPTGSMVEMGGAAWLIHGGVLVEWSPDGYAGTRRHPIEADMVGWVLTPYGTVQALRNGYRPDHHPTLST